MKPKDDLINPELNKKKEPFPITHRKVVLLVGIDKNSDEVILEYFGDKDTLKTDLKEFKSRCKKNSIKSFGSWPGRFRSVIFELDLK